MSSRLQRIPLADYAAITMGQSPPASSLNADERGLPFLQGCAEFGARTPSARLYCDPPLKLASSGGTLISVRAPVGTINRADQAYCIGRGLASFKAKTSLSDDAFLRFSAEHGVGFLHRRSQGSTFLAISAADLQQLPVPMASLPLQRRIAEILSTVDEAIEQTERLIAKHQQIKAGLMHDLFTRGLTADGHLRPPHTEAPHLYKDSHLGPIPKEWEIKRLREVADIQRGKFSIRPRNDPRYYGGDYPFIQTGDVSMAVGRVLTSYTQTLNADGVAVSRLFSAGTVMVTIAANIADTCILGTPMCAPDSLVGVTPRSGGLSRFLELCLHQRKRWFEGRAPKTAQRNINLEDLYPLEIPYPEIEEQQHIAERYEACEQVLIKNEQHLDSLSRIRRGLMDDLLTGRVRVPFADDPGVTT